MLVENVRQALESINSNRLRNGLTIAIIALGITAIVAVMTSIDAVKWWMKNELLAFGANSLTVVNREATVNFGGGRRVRYPNIRLKEAEEFKERMSAHAKTSIYIYGVWGRTVKYGNRTTNPNIDVDGHDENMLGPTEYELKLGRVFTKEEVNNAANVCMLGNEIYTKLFPNNRNPLGKTVFVGGNAYRVIGTFEPGNAGFGNNVDQVLVIPYTTRLKDYKTGSTNFRMSVMSDTPEELPVVEDLVMGNMRLVRGLKARDPNNFGVIKSDAIVEQLVSNLAILRISAIAISMITLFGASIGLMNSMLVSVTERIREIGVRKAMGASSRTIQQQFLIEAMTITQIGGLLGIVLGVLIGNGVGALLNADIQLPWMWLFIAVLLGFGVGILSGFLPARKAARLDPIDSLRYE